MGRGSGHPGRPRSLHDTGQLLTPMRWHLPGHSAHRFRLPNRYAQKPRPYKVATMNHPLCESLITASPARDIHDARQGRSPLAASTPTSPAPPSSLWPTWGSVGPQTATFFAAPCGGGLTNKTIRQRASVPVTERQVAKAPTDTPGVLGACVDARIAALGGVGMLRGVPWGEERAHPAH